MKKALIKNNLVVAICLIMVMTLLVIQLPLSAQAQVANPATATYMMTSYSAPQRYSVQTTGRTIDFNAFDDNVTGQDGYAIFLRDDIYSSNSVARGESYFNNNNCYISLEVPEVEDGNYYLFIFSHQRGGSYTYITTIGIKMQYGSLVVYSVNGQGVQDYMNYVNATFTPNNYTGRSYWAQTADNYEEIAETTRSITAGCNSDEEKVRAIHDWICTNISYDYESSESGNMTDAADASKVFANRKGVCSGYSRLANVMLTAVGIPKMNVQGKACNIEDGVDYEINHEWNLVYYNDSWHIFDFTHDSKNQYYGVGDSRNISGQAPIYFNYDMTILASGQKHMPFYVNMDYFNNDGCGQQIYRLFNRYSGEHFYTNSYDEASTLWNGGWKYEGYAWKSPLRSSIPVYRVFNPNSGEHHYTINEYEKDFLCLVGWHYEGIAWYSDEKSRIATYRLYNPNVVGVASHHYTIDANERDLLMWSGWIYEGVCWYGV